MLYFEAAQARIKAAAELAEVREQFAAADAKSSKAAAELAEVREQLTAAEAKSTALEGELESIKSSYLGRLAAAVQSGRTTRRGGNERNSSLALFRPPVASAVCSEAIFASLEHNSGVDSDHSRPPNGASYRAPANFASSGKQAWDVYGRIQLLELLRGKERLFFPREAKPTVSVILVLHNKAHLSLLSMRSIQQNVDVKYELIVVDNASTDATSGLLKRLDNVTVARNTENRGFAPGCMEALEHCRGDYLCFLNNDALLEAGSLSAALKNFENDSTVGAVGGKVLLADGRLQEAGCILWCDGTSDGYGRSDDPDLPKYQFRRPVDYCSGVFLVTPRKLFQDMGGFDPVFFPGYFEDSDYCMQLWQAGHRVIYEPEAIVRHYENASTQDTAGLLRRVAANHDIFYKKWQMILPAHYEPRGPNVHRARFALMDRGMNILYIEDAVPHRHSGGNSRASMEVMKGLIRQGHHLTCAVYRSPLGEDRYDDVPREVEFLDATSDRDQVLADYLLHSDVIWISEPHNLGDVVARLLASENLSAAVVVCSEEGVADGDHNKTGELDLGLEGLQVFREEHIGTSLTASVYGGEGVGSNGIHAIGGNRDNRIYFVTLKSSELGAI